VSGCRWWRYFACSSPSSSSLRGSPHKPHYPEICAGRICWRPSGPEATSSTSATPTPTTGSRTSQGTPLEDCTKQRNLTDRGREHARAIGEAVGALGIPIGAVLASPLCRTVETATLAFGRVERSPAAREAGPAPPGSAERFTALRRLLSTVPPKGMNAVIVVHGYPFYSLVGGQYLDEGEAAVVRPDGASFQEVVRLGLKQWQALAKSSP